MRALKRQLTKALAGLTLVVVAVVAHAALVFSVESVPPNRSTRGC
jgi:hypothetical protein